MDRRPPARLWDAVTTLADFAIITYAVAPEKLAAHLPQDMVPEEFSLAGGSRFALISAVPFRDCDFRFPLAPWLKFTFCQTNYRAYVRYRDERCVWFFGTSLTSPLVVVPRDLWRLPWHNDRILIDARWEGERCSRYSLRSTGEWGAAEAELEGTDTPMGRLDGFADEEETLRVLTHPMVGHYFRRDGRRGTYTIWHDWLRMQRGIAHKARFQVFEKLGLVSPGAAPHSVLLQRETEFVIFLPPMQVKE